MAYPKFLLHYFSCFSGAATSLLLTHAAAFSCGPTKAILLLRSYLNANKGYFLVCNEIKAVIALMHGIAKCIE